MQFETSTINNSLSIIGGAVVALAAALGIGNLLLAMYNRRARERDNQGEIHETNRGKELDAVSGFQDRLIKRVEGLEDELKEMRIEQLAQARINERLTVENDSVKADNLRQEAEIKELQSTVHRLEVEIAGARSVSIELEQTKTLLTKCESREPLGIETANSLRSDIESIVENVTNLSFMPTSDNPAPDDETAIRRLKEMRAAAKRMKGAINGNA